MFQSVNINYFVVVFTVLLTPAFNHCGAGRGSGSSTNDGAIDSPFIDGAEGAFDTHYEGWNDADGTFPCNPADRWCEGNARHWCEDGRMHYEECDENEYCHDGQCLPKQCQSGEGICTPDGKIRRCNETGSGFSEPEDCPEGQICDSGVCMEIVCSPGQSFCEDTQRAKKCNERGTGWEEVICLEGAYTCIDGECRLIICPPGMSQCVDDTHYHICNETGTDYEARIECPPDTYCYEGGCLTLCEMAELTRSSVGCTFYAVDQRNRYDTADYYIIVANTNDTYTANVTIEHRRGGAWETVVTQAIAPNSLASFQPGNNSQVGAGTGIGAGYGFRIRSDIPITAYQLNPLGRCVGEGSMLIPINGLDSFYYLITYHGYSGPPLFNIVATQDGTTVRITPSQDTRGGGGIPAIIAGTTATITLNECDVAQILASARQGDLSGTIIQADAPIAVFTGTYCSHVPKFCDFCHVDDCTSCDPLEEQLIPKTTWGKQYIAAVAPEYNYGYFRIVAEQDGTTINFTFTPDTVYHFPPGLSPPITLNSLQMAEFEIGCTTAGGGCAVAFLQSDKPFHLINFIEGGSCRTNRCTDKDHCPGNYADPSMITVPPIEQFMREYIFLTPEGFTNNYVTVIREEGAAVTLDGAPVSATFISIPGISFEIGHVRVTPGTHHIWSSLPFGIILEGYGPDARSYGYPGGMNLEIINP